jgi:hypothetical protein
MVPRLNPPTTWCTGNTHQPDVVCPGSRTPKNDWQTIVSRDPHTCCDCVTDKKDLVDAYCVSTEGEHVTGDDTAESYSVTLNSCTAVMIYANCGCSDPDDLSCDGPASLCRTDWVSAAGRGIDCSACAQEAPYPKYQQFADRAEAQTQCVGRRHNTYSCTYIFRKSLVGRSCVGGLCTGNSDDMIDPDITCTAPSVLIANSSRVAGRDESSCCVRTGMCTSNSHVELEPDVVCRPPFQPKAQQDSIVGRTAMQCCEVAGMCVGNTDVGAYPDVVCPAPSLLIKHAAMTRGRTASTCCAVTGMCSGNSDARAEPPIECTSPATLRPHAAAIRGRRPWICCEVKHMCQGNTDSSTDVMCPTPSLLVSNAAMARGTTTSECCQISGTRPLRY